MGELDRTAEPNRLARPRNQVPGFGRAPCRTRTPPADRKHSRSAPPAAPPRAASGHGRCRRRRRRRRPPQLGRAGGTSTVRLRVGGRRAAPWRPPPAQRFPAGDRDSGSATIAPIRSRTVATAVSNARSSPRSPIAPGGHPRQQRTVRRPGQDQRRPRIPQTGIGAVLARCRLPATKSASSTAGRTSPFGPALSVDPQRVMPPSHCRSRRSHPRSRGLESLQPGAAARSPPLARADSAPHSPGAER